MIREAQTATIHLSYDAVSREIDSSLSSAMEWALRSYAAKHEPMRQEYLDMSREYYHCAWTVAHLVDHRVLDSFSEGGWPLFFQWEPLFRAAVQS